MRLSALLLPLAAVAALAAPAKAQEVSVVLGPDLIAEAEDLGRRELDDQAGELARIVRQTLTRRNALSGAEIRLVLSDVKPNRPTMEQTRRRPGLDPIRSVSIGGATIEGEALLADGRREPIRFDYYTTSLADVTGFTTWRDAERAYRFLADNLAEGRFSTR